MLARRAARRPLQLPPQPIGAEPVDPRVHFRDRPLLGRCVAPLDDLGDRPPLVADDPPHLGRLVDCADRDARRGPARRDHPRDVLRGDQRQVAVRDQHLLRPNRRQRRQHRVARPGRLLLHGESELETGRRIGRQIIPHGPARFIGGDHDHRLGDAGLRDRVQHVRRDRPPRDPVQDLGQRRLHPRAAARGQHHGRRVLHGRVAAASG